MELYRPVGVDFLEKVSPLAFWLTEDGAKEDFPDVPVQGYSMEELKSYCVLKGVTLEDLKVYR